MGSALADMALARGASVTVVLGRHTATINSRCNVINVDTTQQMHDVCLEQVENHDIFIMAGAPCDYRPQVFSTSKIKSDNLTVNFVKNPDIAQAIGAVKGDKFLCVFSAETDNGEQNARAKLIKKNADLAVLNNIKQNDVFGSDTNVVSLVTREGITDYPQMSKHDVANIILDRILCK